MAIERDFETECRLLTEQVTTLQRQSNVDLLARRIADRILATPRHIGWVCPACYLTPPHAIECTLEAYERAIREAGL